MHVGEAELGRADVGARVAAVAPVDLRRRGLLHDERLTVLTEVRGVGAVQVAHGRVVRADGEHFDVVQQRTGEQDGQLAARVVTPGALPRASVLDVAPEVDADLHESRDEQLLLLQRQVHVAHQGGLVEERREVATVVGHVLHRVHEARRPARRVVQPGTLELRHLRRHRRHAGRSGHREQRTPVDHLDVVADRVVVAGVRRTERTERRPHREAGENRARLDLRNERGVHVADDLHQTLVRHQHQRIARCEVLRDVQRVGVAVLVARTVEATVVPLHVGRRIRIDHRAVDDTSADGRADRLHVDERYRPDDEPVAIDELPRLDRLRELERDAELRDRRHRARRRGQGRDAVSQRPGEADSGAVETGLGEERLEVEITRREDRVLRHGETRGDRRRRREEGHLDQRRYQQRAAGHVHRRQRSRQHDAPPLRPRIPDHQDRLRKRRQVVDPDRRPRTRPHRGEDVDRRFLTAVATTPGTELLDHLNLRKEQRSGEQSRQQRSRFLHSRPLRGATLVRPDFRCHRHCARRRAQACTRA